jgi:hypothetical protein
MNALAITAITNFILASEVLFLSGMMVRTPKSQFSAAWFWAGTMFLLGLGALIGGIDHGFFEIPNLPRYGIQKLNWFVLGVMTFFLLMTTAKQFFSVRAQPIFLAVAIIQLIVYSILILFNDNFLVVILNYAPVMILLLIMNFLGLKSGAGSWLTIAGILILFAASAIQSIGIDTFSPLDRNGLYHVVSMVGVVFLYLGGQTMSV